MSAAPQPGLREPTDSAAARWVWPVCASLAFLLLAAYLLLCHYVKLYSDPAGYVWRAMLWGVGDPTTSRAPLYPIVLHYLIRLWGRDGVFLSNLPFILVLAALAGAMARALWKTDAQPALRTARLGFLAAVVFLVLGHARMLLELVNPFREPLALSLMAGSVLLVVRGSNRASGPGWRMPLAGLLLGLSTSMRETGILLALPIGLWMAGEMVCERRLRLAAPLLFALGLGLGLVPLLQTNRAHSGSALVPSYAAWEVEHLDEEAPWDIPIPGMSLEHFPRMAPETLRRLYAGFGPVPAVILLAGAAVALVRRQRQILLLHGPAFLGYLLFYCFYRYYRERYLMASTLFALPIMAYGLAAIAQVLEALCRRLRPRAVGWVQPMFLLALLGALAAELVPRMLERSPRTKAWHLEAARRQLAPYIEQPAVFLGNQAFSFRMRWLMDGSFFEYDRAFLFDGTPWESLDARLAAQGARTLERFARDHHYINRSSFALARNWLQRTELLRFADLRVPFDRYGQPEPGSLYKVELWTAPEHAFEAAREAGRPEAVMLDLRRIWDYPGRTFCHLLTAPDANPIPLTNAVQFLALPPAAESGPQTLRIASDGPLPPDPFHRHLAPDDEILLEFGMGANAWAWNLASSTLYPEAYLSSDSCHLYDRGEVLLPHFASSDREVVAEFRVEFVQEDSRWQAEGHRLILESEPGRVELPLPPRRTTESFAVSLGRGRDALRMVSVQLRSTLPAHADQLRPYAKRGASRKGFVKIYDVRLRSLPLAKRFPVVWDAGSRDDGVGAVEGFFARERTSSGTARWSGSRAAIRLFVPEGAGERDLTLRWHVLKSRPDGFPSAAQFTVCGERWPHAVSESERGWVCELALPAGHLRAGAWHEFGVEVPAWQPRRDLGLPDDRELGLHVERVELDAR